MPTKAQVVNFVQIADVILCIYAMGVPIAITVITSGLVPSNDLVKPENPAFFAGFFLSFFCFLHQGISSQFQHFVEA